MSGDRGVRNSGEGRENISITREELNNLIQQSVTAALTAQQAAQQGVGGNTVCPPPPPPLGQQVCTFKVFMECEPHIFGGSENNKRKRESVERDVAKAE